MSIILVFHYTRCGSTVLSDVIDRLPNVAHFGELLNPDNHWPLRLGLPTFNISDGANNLPVDIIFLLEAAIQTSSSASVLNRVFFELTTWDFARKAASGQIEDFCRGFKDIYGDDFYAVQLVRENTFRRFLSSELAESSGIYHSTLPIENRKKIYVDVNRMINSVKDHTYMYDHHSNQIGGALGENFMRMSYEECIQCNPMQGARTMMEFGGSLSISEAKFLSEAAPRILRLVPDPPENLIENFDEVVISLKSNGFSWMLD